MKLRFMVTGNFTPDNLSSSSRSQDGFFRQLLYIFSIMLISAALVISLFLAYYLTGGRYGSNTAIVFQDKNLNLVAGEGNITKDGLKIRQVSRQGVAFVSSPFVNIPSNRYSTLKWYIDGLQEGTDIRFVWATRTAPRTKKETRLRHSGNKFGMVDLAEDSHWQGSIVGIGLMVYGQLPEPLVVRRLQLEQTPPEIISLLAQLWAEWTTFESWSQRSINFIGGGSLNFLFPPVLAIAAWVGLSSLMYTGLMLIRRRPWLIWPLAIFFLLGWLALDARWQWNLWQQLQITSQQFAGKSWEEKRLAEEDKALYRFIRDIKEKLPDDPVRLFLITESPYIRGRAHYHLLPHNVNSVLSLPTTQAKQGDYLLLIRPIQGMDYNQKQQRLQWGTDHSLAVEPVYSSSPGILFRVQRN